jgi:hypothetical protein
MKKTIVTVAAFALALSVVAPNAAFSFALEGSGNSGNAPGQANAKEKCGGLGTEGFVPDDSVVEKQWGKGTTGENTGSANDPKQGDHAVTNCDHYWQYEIPRPATRH